MDELLTFLIKSLVSDEDAVKVEKKEDDKSIDFRIKVAESDLGKVIGKNGKTAASLRNIIRTMAAKEHKRAYVKFED